MFASPGNPYFALVGSGGGGGSLQSPATITPDANGVVQLAMISADTTQNIGSVLTLSSTAGTGGTTILMTDNTGNDNFIQLTNINGGTSEIQLGTIANGISLTANSGADDGTLAIGSINNDTVAAATVVINTVSGSVTLGNPVVAVGTSPTVTVSNPLVALQPVTVQGAAPGTGIFLNGSGGVPSIFANGALQVGTVTHSNLLTVADAPTPNVEIAGALGVGGAVSVIGSVGVTGNIISSAGNVQVVSGGSVSSTAAVAGGGVLNIQNATDTVVPQITMSNANTTINGLVLMPSSLSFQGSGGITAFQTFQTTGVTCPDNTTVSIPNPGGLVVGLYMILAKGGSTFCSVSTISYYDGSTWKWGGGSCCPAFVTSPPSYIGIQGYGATLTLANGGGAGAVTMDFTYLKLGGSLGI
jgi:hypothetical protein